MRAWMLLVLAGCSRAPESTYHRDIRPIFDRTCASCHTEGGVAPTALDSLDALREWGDVAVAAVVAREMPPWGMDADCRDVRGSMWLTAVERELPPDPGEPDVILDFGEPYTPKSGVDDDYRCVAVGSQLEADLYLRGMDIRPDQRDLVHHVLLYAVPPGDVDTARALDAADEGVGWTCFGTSGVGSAQTVGGWAPGGTTELLDEGAAIRVPRGALFVVQMHYNLATEAPAPDRTEVALWTVPEGDAPESIVVTYPVAHTTFQVLAGDTSVVRREQIVPARAEIVGTAPHMHLRGQSLETTILREDGSEACLSRVPAYDFQWQRNYAFETGVSLGPGDRVEIACTYDNTDNDVSIGWGDGTTDEMCLDYLALKVPNTTNGEQGVCAGFNGCFDDCAVDDPSCAFSCMAAAGESCLYCGADQLFEGCLESTCESTSRALGLCVLSCMEGIEEFFSCAQDTCGTQLQAHWECAGPALRGSCADALDVCDG
jgi:hypothetical protein